MRSPTPSLSICSESLARGPYWLYVIEQGVWKYRTMASSPSEGLGLSFSIFNVETERRKLC